MTNNIKQSAPLDKLETIRQTINNKIEEINAAKIFGIWGHEFPHLVEDSFDSINLDIEQNILTLPEPSRSRVVENLNYQLEDLLSLFESIINTTCKNSSLHELVSYILRDLGLSKNIRYLICIGHSLATLPLIVALQDIFYGKALYENLTEYLEERKEDYADFSIIYIPPLVLQKKTFWAAIVHELGHIIVNLYDLVGQFNPKVDLQEEDKVLTDEERNHYHGREYVCDFIGNAHFGPVFYESLYEYIYVNNVSPGGTHPTWDARLYFLQEFLPNINNSRNRIQSTPSENHTQIANINEIISLTKEKVFDEEQKYFENNDSEFENVKNNLKNETPYIGPSSYLLNSYWDNQNEILENIRKNNSESKAVLENRIAPIIEDSIRLTNMKRTFGLMVKK